MKKALFISAILPLFAFLFSGCSESAPEIPLKTAVAQVYSQVLDPYGEGWLSEFDEQRAVEELGISAALYTESSVYASSKPSRCTLLAGFCPAEEKADVLQETLQKVKEGAVIAFDGYLPDQYQIAKSAEIKQYNGYCFLIMTEDNEKVARALEEALNGR